MLPGCFLLHLRTLLAVMNTVHLQVGSALSRWRAVAMMIAIFIYVYVYTGQARRCALFVTHTYFWAAAFGQCRGGRRRASMVPSARSRAHLARVQTRDLGVSCRARATACCRGRRRR